MAQVQLDLILGLEAFQSAITLAHSKLESLQTRAASGVTLKAYLDTSSLQEQLTAARKALSQGGTTIKVATDFYKTGSQYAISATRLKTQVIDPVQQKIAGNRKYTIKIGTELAFDQSSIKQIEQVIAKAKASLDAPQRGVTARQPDVAGLRKQLTNLTKPPAERGLNAAGLQELKTAAKKAGIEISGTTAAELRKEMPSAFAKVADESILGLSRGLASGESKLTAAGSDAGKALLKSLKKFLGIASPAKKLAKEVGEPSIDGVGEGWVNRMPKVERQMVASLRATMGNVWKQGLARDAAARGAFADFGRDAAQLISTSLGKHLQKGVASSVIPALKGALVGGAGGMVTGGLVGGLGAAGAAVRQAAGPAMTAFGSSAIPQKLGMLGHGAASLAGGGSSDAITTFLQNSLESVVQAALGSGGQSALLGAAGVAGVAGMTGFAKGAGGSLVNQAVETIKNWIQQSAASKATKETQVLRQSSGALQAQTAGAGSLLAAEPPKTYSASLSKPQLNLLKQATQLDNTGAGTFGETWKKLGGTLSTKMKLSAGQLKALASEIETNPVLDDIGANAEELGNGAIRVAANIKKKFAALSRELQSDQLAANQGSLFGQQGKAAEVAANIGRNMAGQALQQAQSQARLPESTGGAVSAPIENAGIVMGVLQNATGSVAKALLAFAKELAPGAVKQRILSIVWSIDQAAQQFDNVKRETQILSGKIRTGWDAMAGGKVSPNSLPPQPVPGTGLLRQQSLQLGSVVGRTAFDFPQLGYGSKDGKTGPEDFNQGRGYIEQTRNSLQSIAGKPNEWKVVEEVNGVWQRIKSDSLLARERLRSIAENLEKESWSNVGQLNNQTKERGQVRSRMRVWTDRDGTGTFNPFDQPFYKPTRPPQAPPNLGKGSSNYAEPSNLGPDTPDNNGKTNNIRGYSKLTNEITVKLVNTYVEALRNAIPQVEAASRKLAAAPVQAAQKAVAADSSGLPKEAIKNITAKTSQSYIDSAALSLMSYGIDPLANDQQGKMQQKTRDIVKKKGAYPLIDKIPGVDYDKLQNDGAMGRSTETTRIVKKALLDFYGINDKGVATAPSSTVASTQAAAGSTTAAEQEARQLAQAVTELVSGLASIGDFVKSSSNQAKRIPRNAAQSGAGAQPRSQMAEPGSLPFESNFIRTGPNSFASDGPGGGGFGNRFGTPKPPDPSGALALPTVPVEFFTSFKDAERLLALVEQRLAAVGKAFETLKVKSQLQVDQEVRKLAVSLRAVQLAFDKGEVSATDLKAATYGAAREMAGLGAQSAKVQNLAQAFENLGVQSTEAYRAIQSQRNIDLKYILNELPEIPGDTDRRSDRNRARNLAVNARDEQALQAANDAIRGAQANSGFGGFRGREIGNDVLNKAQQRSGLAVNIDQLRERQGAVALTGQNAETQRRVLAAYTEEIENAERALRVLNGTAKEGETVTHLARNAWGTILDDFQNLVPQLLVFAVAYNLIIQRVLATPGAVIQAAASFDRLETSISAYLSATRGIGDTSGVIGELQGVALDLGIGFEKAASSYLRFAAATQDTPLEGQEVDITRTIATAGRNQGLGGEQIDRASTALTQILSKGRVQSEELRGQLAEQLPGALQVAARAFGVTTKELYRMVEAGQIAGDEFVGRFMRQLKAEGASTNQLAGSFSNVSEQLGSSVQAMGAAAGQPFLAPLTVALQGLNAVIQALIPVAPVLTGLFVVLGANALRAALNHVPLTREILGAARAMFAAKNPAEGYTAGLVRMVGVARAAASALAMVGKAALIGLAFEAVAGAIRFAKGEVGALGDELRKVNKIAEGGKGEGLNGIQKFLGGFNYAQNFSDITTLFDATNIGDSSEKATGKIIGSQKQIAASIKDVNRIDKQLYEERIRRDQAEADKNEESAKNSIERIKKLEEQRNKVQFDFSPEDAQIQLGALKAAEQATEKLIERQKALGNSAPVEKGQLDRLRKVREEFEKTAKAAGLLNGNLLKVQSLGALQSRLKANEEILPTLDVNSETYRRQQLEVAGQRQAVTDQQLLPQERALRTQEMVLRKISIELKTQENIQRVKLSLVDNERKQLEASLSLEQTRGRLREAVAQRRVDVAGALNAPEERLAAESQLQRVRESNQARDLQMQGQLLSKDRERVGVETNLQKEQVKLQTQQLAIDVQMLRIERLKMEAAAKTKGISKDLVREYYLQMGQIDKTVAATEKLAGEQGSLLQSVEAGGAAQLSILGLKQEELNVQQKLLETTGLTEQQVRQIGAAQQDIANKQQSALNVLENAKTIYDRLQESIQGQLEGVRALVQAEQERARLAEQAATNEMAVVDRLLELQQGRNDGGFFERMAKASALGASGEQEAFNLAQRRMELQRQIQQQQIRQKQLEMNLKREELKAEDALNALKLRGLRIENEKAKVQARADLETERLKLVMLGDKASPEQKQLLGKVTDLLGQNKLGGYNPKVPGGGNSQNVSVSSAVSRGELALQQDSILNAEEGRQAVLSDKRATSQERANNAQEQELRLQEQLFKLDAAQWFGQFLDKTTQLGRTLSVVTTGLSEFRGTVSQAFGEAIVNGANASEAIADAGKALAGKVVTGLFDEMVLKPMEANLFNNLKNLLPDLFKTEQQSLTQSTDINTTATNSLTTMMGVLDGTLNKLPGLLKQVDGNIPKPTTDTPVYRAPENVSLAGSVASLPGAASPPGAVVGGIANMLPGTKGGPNFNDGLGAGRGHGGQDLGIDVGDPVHARRSGVVSQYIPSFTRPGARYMGQGLRVKYDDGMEGTYGHMEKTDLRPGDKITAGQFLGKIFPDGDNTHLHYELRNRFMELLEPLKWVKESLTVAATRIQQAATGAPVAPALPPATPVGPAVMSPLTGTPASVSNPTPVTIVPSSGSPTPLQQAGTAVTSQSPLVGAETTQALQQLGGNASQAGQSLTDVTAQSGQAAAGLGKLNEGASSATNAMSGVSNGIAGTPAAFSRLNSTISGVVGVLGSIGVGVAGAQQLGQGGISGTLTGLAGIFGAVSSISGMFGTGGIFAGGGAAAKPAAGMSAGGFAANGMGIAGPNWGIPQRATGGPVVARKPYIVGETGFELFIPESNGKVVSNTRSRALLDARNAVSGAMGQGEPSDPFAANRGALSYSTGLSKERHTERVMASTMSDSPKPLDIRYQSEIINQTEYVSAQQFQRGMTEAAERGRALTFNALKNSVRSRRQVGL